MRERYYYANSMAFTCTATIKKISLDRRTVSLDRTIFFPGGGGQPADRGRLDGILVETVRPSEKDPSILHHTLAYPLPYSTTVGDPVICTLDSAHRWDYMQQHTGQHLLSAVLMHSLGVQTVSVHQGEEDTTIETDATNLSDLDILQIEQTAQGIIAQKRPVTYRVVDHTALSTLPLRRPTSRTGSIRLVEIQDYDRVACGGVHLPDTGWVQLVQVVGVERIRGHMRLSLRIGERALRDHRRNYDTLKAAGELFSAHLDEVPKRIQTMQTEVQELHRTLRLQRERIAQMLVQPQEHANTPGPRVISLEDEDPDIFKAVVDVCATQGENICITHSVRGAENVAWGIVSTPELPLSSENLRDNLLKPHNAQGGGSATRWQGIVPTEQVESFTTTWKELLSP